MVGDFTEPTCKATNVNSQLPTCFLHAGNKSTDSHFAEIDTGNTKLTHVALGASCQLTTVVHTDGARILGEFLKGDDSFFNLLGLASADNFL